VPPEIDESSLRNWPYKLEPGAAVAWCCCRAAAAAVGEMWGLCVVIPDAAELVQIHHRGKLVPDSRLDPMSTESPGHFEARPDPTVQRWTIAKITVKATRYLYWVKWNRHERCLFLELMCSSKLTMSSDACSY
jgi:hypothetical protein